MLFSAALTGLGLLSSLASAASHRHLHRSTLSTRSASGQNVVYWGQNGGGTIENNDLTAYCTSGAGIDILVLAFLYEFGNGNEIASGTIGQSCYIGSSGVAQNCDALASAIKTCQANGVKIILSLGGASSAWSLASATEAETIGTNLWLAFGNTAATTVPRPFGTTFVNGFDFDLESNSGNQYFQYMISTLRTKFATDPANTYYITGAPQCPIPEPNMGVVISAAKFDYLFVQFYNNNNYTYPCALGFNGNAAFNFNQWVTFANSGPSTGAKIFIGVPAAPLASNGAPSGELYYITPTQLSTLVGEYKSNAQFGGIMMWSAGFSDSNIINGCTYAQQAHAILANGAPTTCSGTGSLTTTVTSTPTTISTVIGSTATGTTTTAATSTATGTVTAYNQCGGIGYTGPTACVAGYVCTTNSAYWSQCDPA